jgi:hypothetical protein
LGEIHLIVRVGAVLELMFVVGFVVFVATIWMFVPGSTDDAHGAGVGSSSAICPTPESAR